ncbi:lycopene cyclase domain-containing protein [Echinicola marina]|uniref:lycopene cyclase domain-containing protein n=1 Tax=Echinicola marina TaxID=2859768 RepID=UPI001CF63745|nr:lycopene cyclase domain-containing protein [Echinicola marina]UCS94407.1 lycopene cyclase domain-containing protein [Echinicola marina]
MENYLYLILDIATLLFPLLWSFESKVSYYKKWFALFPAILITSFVFLLWDEWFTGLGVWGFNPRYLTGIYLGSLPLEECLFFLIVPFSTIFIYEILQYYLKKDYLVYQSKFLTITLIAILVNIGLFNIDKWYTSVNFLFVASVLVLHYYIFGTRILGRFYLFYLVHLIPFILFNGALTGAFTPEPVVFYDNAENLSLRIFTIPVEDFVYSMGLMLMNISIYEKIKIRKTIASSAG